MNGLGDAQTGFPLFAGESGDDCVFPDKSADVNTHEPDVARPGRTDRRAGHTPSEAAA